PIGCSHTCMYCGCYSGSANLSVWIGTSKDKTNALPDDCVETESGLVSTADSIFKCNVYIHQAKIRPGSDQSGLADVRVIATLKDTQGSTALIHNSLSPLWNEVITFNCIKMVGNATSYLDDPAMIFLDVYDFDGKKKQTKELICTAILRPETKPLNTAEANVLNLPKSE
ncbi:Otoferlin, partial [Pseudolycoriella hygida]